MKKTQPSPFCHVLGAGRRILASLHLLPRRMPALGQNQADRASLRGVLRQAQTLGLRPSTVIDVGAALGDFTRECSAVFPDSRYILVEPLKEYTAHLDDAVRALRQGEYTLAAATSRPGEATIHVHTDLVGSSLYMENEDSDVNGFQRTVPAVALDYLCKDKGTSGPYLVKIDVQAAELEVLEGAPAVPQQAELVILEVSFFRFFEGGPQFYDVVQYMKSRGFVAYDVFGLQYRLLDNALSPADLVFVPDTGRFRAHHHYATADQRERQNRMLQSVIGPGR